MTDSKTQNIKGFKISDSVVFKMGDCPTEPQVHIEAEIVGFTSHIHANIFIMKIIEQPSGMDHREADIISVHLSYLTRDRKSKLDLL